jgi:hypothetical protein
MTSALASTLASAAVAMGGGCDNTADSSTSGAASGNDAGSGSGNGSNDGGTPAPNSTETSCKAPMPIFNAVDPISGQMCNPPACTPGFCERADIAVLGTVAATQKLQDRLATIDCSPHSVAPVQIFKEADTESQLFAYYLLDNTNFQPSVFTTIIPGVNDLAQRTVWGANCDLATIGAVRLALEPKPGLPTNPDDPRAFIDIFTDIRGLFVINNESGWYEGWMIHDLRVADVAPADANGHAPIGKITEDDAKLLAAMGPNNVPGHLFTVDGQAPHLPNPSDHFPDKVTNVVSLYLSMGAYNALQQSDAHNYWEFNYTTNWIHPLYELPFTGGFPSHSPTEPATAYQQGLISAKQSIVPGNGPADNNRSPELAVQFGDNPDLPRDPDKFEGEEEEGNEAEEEEANAQREFRQRFVPSGIAREVFLNTFERLASFEPGVTDLTQRLLDSYKAAIALADTDGNGIISAVEGDIDTPNPNCPQGDNTCLYLIPRQYDRFAVTREINDALLGPRFGPSTRGFALSGRLVTGFPQFGASQGHDTDNR